MKKIPNKFGFVNERYFRDSIIHFFLVLVTILLVSSNIFLYSELKKVSVRDEDGESQVVSRPVFTACDESCREEIQDIVTSSLAKSTPIPAPVSVLKTSEKTTSFIPLGVTATTTSTDWVDVETSGFSLDLTADYSKNAVVSFETFLAVAHSNGKAFARLFDKTNGIAVVGSEVSVENTDTPTLVTTKNLPIWAGRNDYKVQIKSLNSFEVTFDSGRIKIVH